MKKLIIATSMFALAFCSCQQGVDDIIQPRPAGNDSIYISAAITLDTTQLSGLDTTDKALFTYDAQKRISQAKFHYYSNPPSPLGITEQWYHFQWLYQGSDTLPYKLVLHWGDNRSLEPQCRDTSFFTYTDGRISSDSTVRRYADGFGFEDVLSTQPLGGNAYLVTTKNYSAYPTFVAQFSSEIVWNNGNKILFKDSAYLDGRKSQGQMTYDDHPNPFYRVSLPVVSSFVEYFEEMDRRTTNNETHVLRTGGYRDVDKTITYVYREDGYPVSSKITGGQTKTVYLYTKL